MKKLLLSAIVILGMASCEKETDKMNDIINLGEDIHVSFRNETILVRNQEKINTYNQQVISISCTGYCDYWYKGMNFKKNYSSED